MKPCMKSGEAGCNAEEHGEFPAPVEENAGAPTFASAVRRVLLLFSINSLALAACLLIIAAIVV